MQILKRFITGFLILVLLLTQTGQVHAIFAPDIAADAAWIKKELFRARQTNGTRSLTAVFDQISTDWKKIGRGRGRPGGYSGLYDAAKTKQKQNILGDLADNFIDSFRFFFVNPCLRDDVWELEELRDAVWEEWLKAALLTNAEVYDSMEDAYLVLNTHIATLKQDHGNTQKLFGMTDEKRNYYLNCPYGEFASAWEDFVNSAKTFLGLLETVDKGITWGNIKDQAKKRAKLRAAQWIAANQISLTIGGESGGKNIDLLSPEGQSTFVTEWETMENMIGPVTPVFDWSLYEPFSKEKERQTGEASRKKINCVFYETDINKWRPCTDDEGGLFEKNACERCQNPNISMSFIQLFHEQELRETAKKAEKQQAEKSIKFNLTLNRTGERQIYQLDKSLFMINSEIQRAYEGLDKAAGEALPTFQNHLEYVENNHCSTGG